MNNYTKYRPGYYPVGGEYMKWAQKDHIEKAPDWCSVDLRDGNQALIVPMSLDEKIEFFQYLVKIGFKEIEVGFPAASETEYQFLRKLIEEDMIPELEENIKYITMKLEENENSTKVRLLKVKEMVLQNAHNYA